jgi:hypothetical protein
LLKLTKIKNELIEEREHFMRERLELKAVEESYRGELM